MKTKIFILVSLLTAQSSLAQSNLWSDNTANTLKHQRKEVGVFAPLKVGLTDSLEVSTHPIWFFLLPQVTVKKQWKPTKKFQLASKHKISYPTLFLRSISKNGSGGILPSTSIIPQLFNLNNSLIISNELSKKSKLGFNIGLDLSLSLGESNFSSIDYPLAYPRTYSFNNIIVPYVGTGFYGRPRNKLNYSYTMNTFILTRNNGGFIIEQSLKVKYIFSKKVKIMAGVISSFGDYPYGKDHNIFPMFDLVFGFN